ncbi:MAG: hypothetical protein HDS15_05590 [Bacteroides sp.]|nr:hypothetical protein [Bacteroides sp.]
MKHLFRTLIAMLIIAAMATATATAQRKVTPVDPNPPVRVKRPIDPSKPKPLDRTHVEERRDANGNVILVDTLTGLEVIDSLALANRPRNLYPKLTSVTIGVNIWDPVMRSFGQQYGLGDIWGRLSLYNRYMPFIALGIGKADVTHTEPDYVWRSKAAPYVKVGIDYNVFYNNSPDYQLLVGIHYGLTRFSYEVNDAVVSPGYWGSDGYMNVPSQTSTTGYFEIGAGIRVKIYKQIAAGWTVYFRSIMHETDAPYGYPLYVPGLGKRNAGLGGSLSIIYTIPLNSGKATKVDRTEATATQPAS